MPHPDRPDRYRYSPAPRRSSRWDPRDSYGDEGHPRGYGRRADLDTWMAVGRRASRSLGRFAIVVGVIVVVVVIALAIGAVLLVVWLLGNAGPLTGTLNGVSQLIQQIGKILGTLGGGGGG